MVNSYKISNVDIFAEEVFMRSADLKAGNKQVSGFVRAVNRYVTSKVLRYILGRNQDLINEIYVRLDLATLRRLDNDREEQKKYLRNYLKHVNNPNLMNIFFVKLIIRENEKLEEQDISYLNDILLSFQNDIYVVPILEFEGEIGKPKRVEIYNNFVRNILEKKNQTVPGELRVAMSIPTFYPRRKLNTLFSLFKKENKEPTFVVIDFANQRFTDPTMIGIIPYIHRHFIEENNEKYYIYALNVKPYKKGEATPPAEDIPLVTSGLNAFGSNYRSTWVKIPEPKSWDNLSKIFWPEEQYRYYPLSEADKRRVLVEWLGAALKKPVKLNIDPRVNTYIKQYNVYTLNTALQPLSEGVRKGDKNHIEDNIKKLPSEIFQTVSKIGNKVSSEISKRKGQTTLF